MLTHPYHHLLLPRPHSNPLLHVAKFIHIAEVPVLKDIMLPIFAVFFFIVRIAAAPMAVAVPAFQHAAVVLPRTWAVTMIGLMCFVCALQVCVERVCFQVAWRWCCRGHGQSP